MPRHTPPGTQHPDELCWDSGAHKAQSSDVLLTLHPTDARHPPHMSSRERRGSASRAWRSRLCNHPRRRLLRRLLRRRLAMTPSHTCHHKRARRSPARQPAVSGRLGEGRSSHHNRYGINRPEPNIRISCVGRRARIKRSRPMSSAPSSQPTGKARHPPRMSSRAKPSGQVWRSLPLTAPRHELNHACHRLFTDYGLTTSQ